MEGWGKKQSLAHVLLFLGRGSYNNPMCCNSLVNAQTSIPRGVQVGHV